MINFLNRISRLIPIWLMYVILCIPIMALSFQLLIDDLGPDPIKYLEKETGEIAIKIVLLGLFITPMRHLLGLNFLRFRRSVGVMAFVYSFIHLMIYFVLDQGLDAIEIWKDILKRPHLSAGLMAALLMLPLALTSNNRSVRLLGAGWRNLHKLVYPMAVLVVIHYILSTKTWEVEPFIYAMVLGILLGYRYKLFYYKKGSL